MRILSILIGILFLNFVSLDINAQRCHTTDFEIYLCYDDTKPILQYDGTSSVEINIDRYANKIFIQEFGKERFSIRIGKIEIEEDRSYYHCFDRNNERILIVHDVEDHTIILYCDNPNKKIGGRLAIIRKIKSYGIKS